MKDTDFLAKIEMYGDLGAIGQPLRWVYDSLLKKGLIVRTRMIGEKKFYKLTNKGKGVLDDIESRAAAC